MKFALWICFCVLLTGAIRCHELREVFVEGRIYFLDADCYSRMTRTQVVAERPGTVVRHHEFENFPQGTIPHTTAPLDYLIAGANWMADCGLRIMDRRGTSVLRGQTLDLAGALISPLLGMLTCAWLGVWVWKVARLRRFGGAVPLFFAVSPILVHGTALGRPDHQSLLVLLLAVALGAEWRLAEKRSRPWSIVSGAAWALALWVSFYEPLILLAAVLAIWLVAAPRGLLVRERVPGLIAFCVISASAWLIEGWRIHAPDRALLGYLANWSRSIGELAHPNAAMIFGWLGWGCLAAPVLLVLARREERRALAMLALLLVAFALTCWQVRWGYFLTLIFAMALPWQLAALRTPWIAWLVLIVSLWPMARDWEARLFPDAEGQRRLVMERAEKVALREIAEIQRERSAGPFVAPWWMSPSIAYWSRQPGIAGSSHESLPGIVDSARIYLAPDAGAALPILRARSVRWILSDAPERIVRNSAAILGVEPHAKCLAHELNRHVLPEPWTLSIIPEQGVPRPLGNDFFRVWRVRAESPPAKMEAP